MTGRTLLLWFALVFSGCAAFDKDTPAWDSHLVANTEKIELAYQVKGEGEPIVLVHGFGASHYSWRYVIDDLARNHRVYALDLKGFGDSIKPRDNRYSIYDQANLVRNFILHHRLENVTLIGHSYGGAVSLASALYLQQTPGYQPKRLVLIDSIAYKQKLPLFIEILATPLLGPASLEILPNKLQVKVLLQEVYYDDKLITAEAINHYAANLAKDNAKYALIITAKQILPQDLTYFNQQFTRLTLPTLIIASVDDSIVPLAVANKLHQALTRSQLILVKGVGHAIQEEQPQTLLVLLRKFLK